MIKKQSGSYPSVLQGTITFKAGGTGDYSVGETVTGTGFTAKVVKWVSADRKLTVKKIAGNLIEDVTVTGGTSGAAYDVAALTSASVGGIDVYTGGWNLRETTAGIARSKVAGARTLVEVMLAEANMSVTRGDFATPATFALGAWVAQAGPDVYDISAGDYIAFTITSSEPVRLPVGASYPFTLTGATTPAKSGVLYNSSSDGLTHSFRYAVGLDAGDTNATAVAIAATNFNLNNGTAYEVAADGSEKALSAPVAVGGTLAGKSVTVQA
jgi:hypothetical protein